MSNHDIAGTVRRWLKELIIDLPKLLQTIACHIAEHSKQPKPTILTANDSNVPAHVARTNRRTTFEQNSARLRLRRMTNEGCSILRDELERGVDYAFLAFFQTQPQRQSHQPIGEIGGHRQTICRASNLLALGRAMQRHVMENAANTRVLHRLDERVAALSVAK